MISVIIPAYNEADVIADSLIKLVDGVEAGNLEIIVVCNGCNDETPNIVRSFGSKIKLIETDIASKTHALNLGDKTARGYPRFYLDADVILDHGAVVDIANAMRENNYLAASPKLQMDHSNSSWVVKWYYDVWSKLSYVQEGMIGTGVYALSEEGRKRFDHFPDVIADDGFIRALFRHGERGAVDNRVSIVRSPTCIRGLIKIKTRSRLGRYELKDKYPELVKGEGKNYPFAYLKLACKFSSWIKLLIYLFINLYTRMRAIRQYRQQVNYVWERDLSSRHKVRFEANE